MTKRPRSGELEIDQDPDFQRREWKMQRVGRVVLLAIILATLVGVFGAGPISTATVRSPDGRLEVAYNRMARHAAPDPLRIRLAPGTAVDSLVDLWIDQRYVHGLVVRELSPEPIQMRAGEERLIYRFRIADPSRAADIVIHADADKLWLRRGAIGLVNGDSVRLRQFVFP